MIYYLKCFRKRKGGIWIKTKLKGWLLNDMYEFYVFNNLDPIKLKTENYTKIGLMREKLKNQKWALKTFKIYLNIAEDLNDFKSFKCNSFFVGEEKARYNQRLYDRQYARVKNKIAFLSQFIH